MLANAMFREMEWEELRNKSVEDIKESITADYEYVIQVCVQTVST